MIPRLFRPARLRRSGTRQRGIASAAVALALASLAAPIVAADSAPATGDWPQWRGPLATGVAPSGDPPVEWGEGKNVRWKVPIPGRGHSTPIVRGSRIFLTTAIPSGEAVAAASADRPGAHDNVAPDRAQEFVVLALDRGDGSVLWQRTVRRALPHEGVHQTGSWASGSAITDGERVFAFFGSHGLHALDLDGRPLWQADFGDMQTLHGHGEGSSPALHGETLIVNWDHEGDSFLIALDKRTGEQRWKVARDEVTSWSTPLVVEHAGRPQVVVSATRRIRGYDLASGDLVWEWGGLSHNVVASPVAGAGFVYAGSSYETRALVAIRLAAAKGDVTGTPAVAWTRDRDTPYVPSPLLYGDALCFVKHIQGFLTCVAAKSGETWFGPERLPGIDGVFASPVGAAGRIYVVGRNGATVVLRHGPRFEPIARNVLEESFAASPAVAGNELYLRGERHLYCIAEEPPRPVAAEPGRAVDSTEFSPPNSLRW